MAKTPKKPKPPPGLAEAAMLALESFGGLKGLIALIREEYDRADPGSKLRYDYANMLVKLVTTNALSGGAENPSSMTDEEFNDELKDAVRAYVNEETDTPPLSDEPGELDEPPDE